MHVLLDENTPRGCLVRTRSSDTPTARSKRLSGAHVIKVRAEWNFWLLCQVSAGFGNRSTDDRSYRTVGDSGEQMFTFNPRGCVICLAYWTDPGAPQASITAVLTVMSASRQPLKTNGNTITSLDEEPMTSSDAASNAALPAAEAAGDRLHVRRGRACHCTASAAAIMQTLNCRLTGARRCMRFCLQGKATGLDLAIHVIRVANKRMCDEPDISRCWLRGIKAAPQGDSVGLCRHSRTSWQRSLCAAPWTHFQHRTDVHAIQQSGTTVLRSVREGFVVAAQQSDEGIAKHHRVRRRAPWRQP